MNQPISVREWRAMSLKEIMDLEWYGSSYCQHPSRRLFLMAYQGDGLFKKRMHIHAQPRRRVGHRALLSNQLDVLSTAFGRLYIRDFDRKIVYSPSSAVRRWVTEMEAGYEGRGIQEDERGVMSSATHGGRTGWWTT